MDMLVVLITGHGWFAVVATSYAKTDTLRGHLFKGWKTHIAYVVKSYSRTTSTLSGIHNSRTTADNIGNG
jgi:hypothetical protein